MTKHLDTSNLTKYTKGNNKGHFNWKENIGKELSFQYDDLTGTIKIIDYKSINRNNLVTIQYQNNIITTSTPNLLQLKIPSFFNKNRITKEYTYKIGDVIDKDYQKSKVIEQCRINLKNEKQETTRGYKLKCLCCGYEYKTREDRLSSCPVCGIRSTWTERFVFSILIQAKIDFEVQKEFEWLQNRWYDVYLPKYNTIIEINGTQHYEPVSNPSREQKSAEQQYLECIKSDKLKYDAAIKNGLSYYIIDARDQKELYNTAKSILTFIDFSNISAFECGKFAINNVVKKYCDLWNKGYSIEEIANKLNCSTGTVQRRLREGHQYNLCVYNKNINMKNHKIINPNKKIEFNE